MLLVACKVLSGRALSNGGARGNKVGQLQRAGWVKSMDGSSVCPKSKIERARMRVTSRMEGSVSNRHPCVHRANSIKGRERRGEPVESGGCCLLIRCLLVGCCAGTHSRNRRRRWEKETEPSPSAPLPLLPGLSCPVCPLGPSIREVCAVCCVCPLLPLSWALLAWCRSWPGPSMDGWEAHGRRRHSTAKHVQQGQ